MCLKTISASLALLGLALGAAHAGEATPAASTASPQATPQAAGDAAAQGRRAVRDKDTGKFRAPTMEELEAEKAERKARGLPEPTAKAAPLALRQHPNGMRSAVLGPEYLVTLKAERGADGRLIVRHANPAHEHQASPTHPQAATAAKE
jgi:hypothetical protein